MAYDPINRGSAPNDPTADTLYIAFGRVIANFTELYAADVTLTTAVGLKAPLASPAFTGTPAAPTATAGTNTTQISTTAFVRTEIANLVASAPGTLDTLDELAAALGDDANFATTVTNSLALKVTGPASVTDDLPAVFDGTTGKLLKQKTYAAFKTLLALVKGDVGLGSVDNTSDATKNSATATLASKTLASPLVTGLMDASDSTAGQFKFPATQNPSANANTLDDYEEGTWTPVLTFATPGNLSVAYSAQAGSYIKIGKLVTITFNILTSAFTHTTASGDLTITGLPFTCQNVVNDRWRGTVQFQGITKANYTNFTCGPPANTTTLLLIASGSAQSVATVTAADMPSGGSAVVQGSVTYMATN